VTSYFEWLGAGVYRADPRSGAMHGRQLLVREVHYGADGASAFFRLDFDKRPEEMGTGIELRLRFLNQPGAEPVTMAVQVNNGVVKTTWPDVEVALRQLLEIKVPLRAIRAESGTTLQFQISLWQGGLPLGTLPHEGWLRVVTVRQADWAG
jgi:uncharacterized membrane protein